VHDLTQWQDIVASFNLWLATVNERALADKGYIGEDVFINPIRNAQEQQ